MVEGRIRLAGNACLISGILWVFAVVLTNQVTDGSAVFTALELLLVAAPVR